MLSFAYAATALTVAVVLFIILYVFIRAVPHVSWKLLSTKPSYINDTIGVLPDILNTIYIVIATLVFVLPLGVGAAVYLSEYAKNMKVKRAIEYAIESLAGIPSIIYGLVGMLIFCQYFGLKTSLLAGALTLTIMNLPTIIRTTQESLDSVVGTYCGVLQTDVETILTLNINGTYLLIQTYKEEQNEQEKLRGTFQVLDGNILMFIHPSSGDNIFYKVRDDNNIILIDSFGNEPKKEDRKNYILKKR